MFRILYRVSLIFTKLRILSICKYLLLKAFKFKGEYRLYVKGLDKPLYIRFGTSDVDVFNQIIIDDEFGKFKVLSDIETIVDAGANIGLSSIYFRSMFPFANIWSIEPEHENFLLMKKNLGYDSKCILLKKALWHESTELFLNDRGTGSWGFSVTDMRNETPVTTVDMKTLFSDYNLEVIDLLKIDIEGSEKELFEMNSAFWIPKCRFILVEVHDYIKKGTSRSVFNIISDYDFDMEIMGEYMVFKNNTWFDETD